MMDMDEELRYVTKHKSLLLYMKLLQVSSYPLLQEACVFLTTMLYILRYT